MKEKGKSEGGEGKKRVEEKGRKGWGRRGERERIKLRVVGSRGEEIGGRGKG